MRSKVETPHGTVHIGTRIRIIRVAASTVMTRDGIDRQALELIGKTGTVERIDDAGQLWGDWGGLAILPDIDKFEIL